MLYYEQEVSAMKMGLAIAMRRESLGLTQEEVAKYVF